MADHTFCRLLLSQAREELREQPKLRKLLAGMTTWHEQVGSNKYYEVYSKDGQTIWTGKAHCSFEAKANTILHYVEKTEEKGEKS